MTRIGIYRVDRDELESPPEERMYYQQALFDTETGEWIDTSDPKFISMAPDEKTIEAFDDRYATARSVVAEPDDIPGEIVVSEPSDEATDTAW
jgi:hypothetical protein